MATEAAKLSNVQLEATISRLNTKLARQTNAVKETEAHIQALKTLIAQNASTK